jgi:hypothetical protein
VGEYDIVVLGTNDSSALDTWLREHRYHIPEGAGEALRPYVESGMKFFVARVNAERVHFESGRAVLSPLRVAYESEQLALPVRLGLLNSSGTQDLVITVVARNQRYEVANYPNVFIPTNLDLSNEARTHFADVYNALFDRTLAQNPGAVVTEYAWQATTCDPCPPDATLDETSLTTLGGDVLYRNGVQPASGGWGGPIGLRGGGAMPSIRSGELTTEGELSREVVRRVMRRHINELRYCQESEMARNGNATGIATFNFVIGPTGQVVGSDVVSSDAANVLGPALLSCMSGAVRRWTFPTSEDGEIVRVSATMHLSGNNTPPPSAPGSSSANLPTASADEFVVTRMHYRYGSGGLREDLVFRAAEPVVGGREEFTQGAAQSQTATPSNANNFQARYVIRHPWEGAMACDHPVRDQWGGPPEGQPENVAVAPSHGPRTPVQLETMLVPTLAGAPSNTAPPAPTPTPAPVAPPAPTPPPAAQPPAPSGGFCAAQPGASPIGMTAALSALALLLTRKRRR